MLLGFQHYILVLGMTVLIPSILVPQMGGDNVRMISVIIEHYLDNYDVVEYIDVNTILRLQLHKAQVIQTQLFLSGLNTLAQTLFGTRLPSIVGGSYAFTIPITSIIQAQRYQRIKDSHEVSLSCDFWFLFFLAF